MKKVVVIRIESYDQQILQKRITQVLQEHFPQLLSAMHGKRILLKPNFLMEADPQEAITTHPALLEAVAAIFRRHNLSVAIADSPGGFASNKHMDVLYENLGIKDFAQRLGVSLLYPDRTIIKSDLPLCWWTEGFTMVNMPKLKTHEIMVMTLATKNLYGCISGLHKSNLHKMYPKTGEFTAVIAKLYKAITPALNIVDGILALEGHGPAKKGVARKLNVIAIGDDALYTDYVLSNMLGLPVERNPLIKFALKHDLIRPDNVSIVSEFTGNICSDFVFPGKFVLDRFPKPLVDLIMPLFRFYPHINTQNCTRCLKCKEVCPVGAISSKENKLLIDRTTCIMCMCCQEMCKFGAVDLKHGLILRMIKKLSKQKSAV